MARTTDIDWLAVGREALKRGGHTALKVEALCRACGRTKGSLYHHYPSLTAFKQALLERWREEHTEHLIAVCDGVNPAPARRAHLERLALSLDMTLEHAMRNWAAHDPLARKVVDAVDRRRIAYLAKLEREDGESDPEVALQKATAHYALYLGLQQLPGRAEQTRLRRSAHRLRIVLEPE